MSEACFRSEITCLAYVIAPHFQALAGVSADVGSARHCTPQVELYVQKLGRRRRTTRFLERRALATEGPGAGAGERSYLG